jgi:hypothetical protein
MKLKIVQIISLSLPLLLSLCGSGAELGTRQRTICPVALLTNTLEISPSAVSNYAIYGYRGPLGHNVAIDNGGTGMTINFLGELQSADTLSGSWNDVTNTSPYSVSAANGAKFYRAAE